MKIIQILILVILVLYMVISSINIMEQGSDKSKEQFKVDRNWKLSMSLIIGVLLYLAGSFDQIF